FKRDKAGAATCHGPFWRLRCMIDWQPNPERRSAAGVVFDPSSATVYGSELSDEREADPSAGHAIVGFAAVEALEDCLALALPDPRSPRAISTTAQSLSPRASTSVPAGVCLTALASRFSTIRSTLAASTAATIGSAWTSIRWPSSA